MSKTYEANQQRSEAANKAFWSFMEAYAEAIGERPAKDDPETRAARKVAAEAFGYLLPYPVTDDDRATVDAMVEAIASAARFMRPFAIASAAADRLCEAYDATTGNLTAAAYDAAQVVARAEIAGCHATDTDYAWVMQMVEAIADAARAANPENLEEPAPVYQRHELEAYLGEPDDYDVDAIEAEATRFTADGARVWSASDEELAAIAERHELYAYAPTI